MMSLWRDLRRHLQPERLRRLLHAMVEIYSPSGKEGDIQLFLETVLRQGGWQVLREVVDEERFNLRCVPTGTEPDFYLVGHVDTVPDWELQEQGPVERNGMLHGLGAADMKAGCAAMVEAFLVLAEHFPAERRPAAGLLLVVGEEEDGAGSTAFLQQRRPAWVVIGEPTGLTACCAHYGYLEAVLTTRGRRSHASLPEHGHNAVEAMLRTLLYLGRAPLLRRADHGLVYSIREMNSSRAGFVIPDRCETWIDLHLPPHMSPAEPINALRRRLAAAGRQLSELDLEIAFPWSSQGFDLGIDHWPANCLREVLPELSRPVRFGAFRSHSDGNLFFEQGCRPLLLGPGALETAHTPEEQVPLQEVTDAAALYLALCLAAPVKDEAQPSISMRE